MHVILNRRTLVFTVSLILVLIVPNAFGKPNPSQDSGRKREKNKTTWVDEYRKIKKIRENKAKKNLQYLLKTLRNKDENWKVRLSAYQALSKLGSADSEEVRMLLIEQFQKECMVDRKNLKPPIKKSFGSEDYILELRMKSALIKFIERSKVKRQKEILKSLSKRLKNVEDDNNYSCYLAMILGRFGRSNSVPVLIRCLKNSSDGLIRKESAEVLGELGNKKAIPALKNALNDQFVLKSTGDVKNKDYGHVVRRAAAQSLKKIGVDVEKIGKDKYKVKGK